MDHVPCTVILTYWISAGWSKSEKKVEELWEMAVSCRDKLLVAHIRTFSMDPFPSPPAERLC